MPVSSTPTEAARDIRYEPDERPPLAVSIALALQFAIPCWVVARARPRIRAGVLDPLALLPSGR